MRLCSAYPPRSTFMPVRLRGPAHFFGAGAGNRSRTSRSCSKRAKREYDEMFVISPADRARVRKLMPYAK